MAIKYTKGKKKLEYTGIDKVTHAFGSTLEKIKSGVTRAVKAPVRANKRYNKAKAMKEIDNISRAFGNVENYEKLYPDTKKRNRELMRRAYDK